MQKFSSFPSYKVLDRTKRDPEKEMGDHIFVGRCHLVTSPQEDLRPAFEKSQSSDNVNAAATQELRPTEVSPPETGSIVARWAQEKRHEAAFLPVPRLPQPSPREPHVLLVDTPTA
ncbi:Hypothetical protein, putative [Bodo saltans]|uniref:Uncharacterized protein n=1 Tax=Bodo saltans TaxID=75058 RepID=A0A0S4JXG0_BODSA|nr:Hypothetical protein, putative [Bodo saltans]|eukprot:CUG94088.1 Hypothetical protein, putative [Bodo saltans]